LLPKNNYAEKVHQLNVSGTIPANTELHVELFDQIEAPRGKNAMKSNLFRSILASILISMPTVGMAQDFNAGLKAARAGDFETALKEWKPLAEQGDAQSQSNLGQMYSSGQGVPQDYTEAVKWFRRASEQGDAFAQSYLGYLYFNGLGIAQDYAEAVRLYKQAADQGLAEAQLNLGNKYLSGEGVRQDYVEARRWYTLAAEQGMAQAQYHLGYLYFEGFGVPQDYIMAYMWSDIAFTNGEETAGTERDHAAAKLTPADIAEAQRRAGVCFASNYQDCYQNTASVQQAGALSDQQENDAQRLKDILAISDMVEAYYEINNHYPWVKEPQAETINIFISDNIPPNFPPSAPYQLLEAELQKTLGTDAVFPKDPEDDGLLYQYATNGINYFVAAYLYNTQPYAWEQGRHANKVEITNSPNLETQSHRPYYLRHVIKFGPDDANKQAEFIEALQEHKFDAAAAMLKNGANPSPTCAPNYRCQPLATAAMDGDLEVMKFLIDNGADLDGYNSYDDVALIYALENQQFEAAKLLVESGANVNIPNAFGFSPFVGSPASGDVELLTLMIQNGAELNKNFHISVGDPEPGEKGPLPLEVAIRYGQPDIISSLLSSGADPSMHTSSGETIAELGRKSESEAIRQLF
jgi:TPR repeat protein/ankyrin repeat protein